MVEDLYPLCRFIAQRWLYSRPDLVEDATQEAVIAIWKAGDPGHASLIGRRAVIDFYRRETKNRNQEPPRLIELSDGIESSPGVESEASALRFLYDKRGLSLSQIGKVLGKDKKTIARQMERHGIPRRKPVQASHCGCGRPSHKRKNREGRICGKLCIRCIRRANAAKNRRWRSGRWSQEQNERRAESMREAWRRRNQESL